MELLEAACRTEDGEETDQEQEKVVLVHSDGQIMRDAPCFQCLEDTGFSKAVLEDLGAAGITKPTSIQRYAWPLILQGRDIIGLAKTGCGKTLAFLLPAFARMQNKSLDRNAGVQLLVLTPTRELACQIVDAATKFGGNSGTRAVSIYGGVAHATQLRALRTERPQCVVACPGRLNDLLNWKQIFLNSVCILVVDEADRLLDMGFEPQVRKILEWVPSDRQSLLFSATWPEEVRTLAADILHPDHIEIRVGRAHQCCANESVSQDVTILPSAFEKENALLDLLRRLDRNLFQPTCARSIEKEGNVSHDDILDYVDKVIIFCTMRASVDSLYSGLVRAGLQRCAAIHSEHDQDERQRTIQDFRNGKIRVLVATDVAARGLDIQGVSMVINFEPPHSYNVEDYVHRIGRTGRAGKRGRAITFLTPQDANQARAIVEVMQRMGQTISSDLEQLAAQAKGSAKQRRLEKRRRFRGAERTEPNHRSMDIRILCPKRLKDEQEKRALYWLISALCVLFLADFWLRRAVT